jgi:hypothetical protein
MVINKSSLPLFSYDRRAKKDEFVTDDEMLLSSFFSAIINFAEQLKADDLKYIVFDNRSFVLKKSSDFTVIFSTYSKFKDAEITKLEELIESTSKYLVTLLKEEGLLTDSPILQESVLRSLVNNFAKYLLDNGIIIDAEFEFDPLYVQKKYRKMIFKSIGYEPGKCNIGPQERLNRLIVGLLGLLATVIVFAGMIIFDLPQFYRIFLFFPITWCFIGFYQYFFKFCVFNGLTKKAVMR